MALITLVAKTSLPAPPLGKLSLLLLTTFELSSNLKFYSLVTQINNRFKSSLLKHTHKQDEGNISNRGTIWRDSKGSGCPGATSRLNLGMALRSRVEGLRKQAQDLSFPDWISPLEDINTCKPVKNFCELI